MGSIDLLAIMLKVSFSGSDQQSEPLNMIMKHVLGQAEKSAVSLRICLFNVLITAAKMMQPANLENLTKQIVNPLMQFAANKKMEPVFRSATLQVLFTITFQLATNARPYGTDLLSILHFTSLCLLLKTLHWTP